MSQKVIPGQFLGYIFDYTMGEIGVFQKDDKLYSSLTGKVTLDNRITPPKINVISESNNYQPHIKDEIYAKITKVLKTYAFCEIFATKDKVILPLQGIIKHENIKNDYKDFDIFDCFVPGDIIFGEIIAVDQSKYIYVSVSGDNQGVVFAKSKLSNNLMMPISWEQMECLDTHIREKRKVAKPDYM